MKASGRHTDDGDRHAVDDYRLTDRVGYAAEPPNPKGMTDNRHGRRASSIVGVEQQPPGRRSYAQRRVVVAGDELTGGDLRIASDRQIDIAGQTREAEHPCDAGGFIAEGLVRRKRERRTDIHRRVAPGIAAQKGGRVARPGPPLEEREIVGGVDRQLSKEHRVGQAEHGGRRADADGQGEHRNDRERGRPEEQSNAEADVLDGSLQRSEAPHVPRVLALQRNVTEHPSCFVIGFTRIQSIVDERLTAQLDVQLNLVGQIVVEMTTEDVGGQAAEPRTHLVPSTDNGKTLYRRPITLPAVRFLSIG